MIQAFFVHYIGSELSVICLFSFLYFTYFYFMNRHFSEKKIDSLKK